MAGKAKVPGNGGKTRSRADKRGSQRAAFDTLAALEALKFAQGGVQQDLPGMEARRFVGVQPLPDDAQPRGPGRPPGAVNLVAQAFREYLAARYGSPVEGLVQFAGRPVVSIVAELVEAHRTVCEALQISSHLGSPAILELVKMAPGLKLAAQRYAAPYTATQAPQPQPAPPAQVRIGVSIHTNGQPQPAVLVEAQTDLADLLGIEQNQRVSDADVVELDAVKLDAGGDHAA